MRVTAVMKGWVVSLLVAVCVAANAEEFSPEFDYHRVPTWPYSFYQSGKSGWVLFEINAHHDGRTSGLRVLDSAHHLLSRSVEAAVPNWRVKPWIVSDERPAVITVRQEYFFVHPREGTSTVAWLRGDLRHLSCTKFNARVDDFQRSASGLEVIDMSVFRHTFRVLARWATYRKLPDDRRYALGDALEAAVPEVIRQCRANPDLRYKDVLPEPVRVAL